MKKMLKQMFTVSHLLNENKYTFPMLVELYKKRLKHSSSQVKWDLISAVCLERQPVITKAMTDIETRVQEMLHKIECENSIKSNFEMKKESEENKNKSNTTRMDITDTNVKSLQTIQDFEDACEEELNKFQFAPRITEFDKSNKTNTLMRKLDKTLVLVVQQKVGKNMYWLPPQSMRKEGETMRQSAERALEDLCGTDIKVKFYGNAPVGFYKYKYPAAVKKSDSDGAKIFFFLAKHISGYVANDIKHQWLDRDELKKTLYSDVHNSMSQFLITD